MRCDELMKSRIECLSPRDTVQAAAKRMRDANVGFLPICDEHRVVRGTITDRDLTVRVLAGGLDPTTPVEEVMTREIVACRPRDDLRIAQRLMAEHRKSRVMCTDDQGRLVGIISLSDLAQRADGARTLREVTTREARP